MSFQRSLNTLDVLQKIPSPDLGRLFGIAHRDEKNNILEERKSFVVTVRDLFPGARSQLATTLKVCVLYTRHTPRIFNDQFSS